MVYSTLSPTRISVKSPDICASCVGHECVNGSYAPQSVIRLDDIPSGVAGEARQVEVAHGPRGTLGCGTELFAPQIRSNLDCTQCLDCVRACPHDNVSLFTRRPDAELSRAGSWSGRWDLSLLVIALAFMGLSNAFGMAPPYYALQEWLALGLGLTSEFVVLLLIFAVWQLAVARSRVGRGRLAEPGADRLPKARFPARYRGPPLPRRLCRWVSASGSPTTASTCWSAPA